MLSYIVLLATAIAGVAHASIWTMIVGVCLLSLAAVAERRFATAVRNSPSDVDFEALHAFTVFLNSSGAAAAAYFLGRAASWFWLS